MYSVIRFKNPGIQRLDDFFSCFPESWSARSDFEESDEIISIAVPCEDQKNNYISEILKNASMVHYCDLTIDPVLDIAVEPEDLDGVFIKELFFDKEMWSGDFSICVSVCRVD